MFTSLFTLNVVRASALKQLLKTLSVLIIINFVAFSAFSANIELSPSIQVINIYSGAPQAIDGPSKYAGFGDIAANLVAATEIKARYPERKVRLIVTTAYTRIDPLIPTTDEIVKIMVPHLDPSKKNVVQMYGDVEVVFAPVDFGKALQINSLFSYYLELFKLKMKVSKVLPYSDLNLNFSAYPGARPILRVNTKLAVGVEEHYGDFNLINELAPYESSKNGAFSELTSGPYSTGFMLTFARQDRENSLKLIRDWGEKNGKAIPKTEFLPQIAYSAGWQAIQVYIDALSQLELPDKPLILFVKDFPELKYEKVPKSVIVIPVKGLPHEVMSALIQESHFAPLVTGDISYGQALSTVRKNKSFIYESPEWKVESAEGTKLTLAADLGIDSKRLDSMFLMTEQLMKLDDKGLKQKAFEVAQLIGDKSFQSQISEAIKARHSKWDIIGNTLGVANHLIDNVGLTRLKKLSRKAPINSLISEIQSNFGNKILNKCFLHYDKK